MSHRYSRQGVSKTLSRRLAACLFTGVSASIISPSLPTAAYAQTAAPPHAFAIPAGPLSQALAAFGRQSGLQVSYLPETTAGARSSGVSGSLSPAQALSRLLQGTGLSYRFANASTVTIQRPGAASAVAAVPAGAVQLDTIDVQGQRETAWSPVKGYVARQSATATKTDTPLIETPQAVSVVTRDQVEQQGAQSLKDALGYTSGVAATTRSSFSGVDIMYSRGFGLDRYLDGMKVLGGAGYTVPQIESYGAERLEVFHGPTSVLYGQASPGGLVNVVSKRPLDTPFHEIELQTGNFGRFQGAFDITGPATTDKTLLYRLTGVVRNVDSQVDSTRQQRFYIAPALTWQPDGDTSLTVLAKIQHDPKVGLYSLVPAEGTIQPNPYGRIPRSRFLGDSDYNDYSRDQQSIGYAFEHRFDETWTVRQNFRFMHTDGDIRQLLPLGQTLDDGGQTLDRYSLADDNNINALTLDNQAQAKFATGPLGHTLLMGFDYQRLSESDRLGEDLAPSINIFAPAYGFAIPLPPVVSNTNQVTDQFGLYGQDQVKFDRFNLTLSGRQDWVDARTKDRLALTNTDQDDHKFTWRAGLNYVFDNGFAPYVSYSTSFQPTSGVDANSRPFKPTTGQQYEGGIKYQPVGWNASITAAVFNLTQQNVLTPDPNNLVFNIQTGEIRSRGVEIEGKASLTEGLDLIASYTHADVEVTKSNGDDLGKRPLNIPANTASAWAFYSLQGGPLYGLGFGAGIRYVGNTAGSADNSLIVPSNTLVDAALQYDFGKRWKPLDGVKLTLNVTNLFDRRYVSECSNGTNCLYGPGRTIIAGLKYQW